MIDSYLQQINWAKSNKKSIDKTLKRLKTKKEADRLVNDLHHEVFEKIDCLNCANCCKTTGPLLTSKDISRVSSRLKMKEQEFIATYLRIDEDQDYVFNTMPCPFLLEDNYCSIYEDRPRACRAFPHTDQKGQMNIANLTRKNARICPAVSSIMQKLEAI
ncbi:MAG: YkgJ family cysteine cluster protein [Salibacteraceae bacterium]|nr:YkgJ family cysteine cluster protein [Salibacteraceae bacterium]MDP4685330.1 YkgJ family cysteine cluster protein [Salibacteraceae bacterium]MDP4762082.1 YkgJ family cysteine cluster protein [Salibacteraceae bacterium]MDP4964690.1 YkgJ family cysteine cluster protein [Salibacteraceae bacterium]